MKNSLVYLFSAGLLLLASCQKNELPQVSATQPALKTSGMVLNFTAHLSGAAEVPANDSRAVGEATFQLSKDGNSLSYKLYVAEIQNVTMAHIHIGPVGQNGAPAVWLYPSAPPAVLIPGPAHGMIAQGTFTAADFIGPLAGMTMTDLIQDLQDGNAYVNVHTNQFPGGEIRGQISGVVPPGRWKDQN
jgi:hypothetical protein